MNNLQHLFDHDGQFQDMVVNACMTCAATPCFENDFEAYDYLMDEHEPASDAEELAEIHDMLDEMIEFLEGMRELVHEVIGDQL